MKRVTAVETQDALKKISISAQFQYTFVKSRMCTAGQPWLLAWPMEQGFKQISYSFTSYFAQNETNLAWQLLIAQLALLRSITACRQRESNFRQRVHYLKMLMTKLQERMNESRTCLQISDRGSIDSKMISWWKMAKRIETEHEILMVVIDIITSYSKIPYPLEAAD